MATYVVGDIQGCYDELQRLLEHVRFDPAVDELWCSGDLVNRGGQSLETLRLLASLPAVPGTADSGLTQAGPLGGIFV